jgi:hypothetical protein
MAIDTAEKRRNAATAGMVYMIPGVTPNAAKDLNWRWQSGWSYGSYLAEPELYVFRLNFNITGLRLGDFMVIGLKVLALNITDLERGSYYIEDEITESFDVESIVSSDNNLTGLIEEDFEV